MSKRKRRELATTEPAVAVSRAFAGYSVDAATLEGWYSPLSPSEAMALGLSSVWRCVTLLADAIAGRRWREVRGTDELPPSRIVRRPAASMTRRAWTWRVVATLALYNRAPLWMVGGVDDEGVPGSLLPIPPDQVTPAPPIDELGIRRPTAYMIGRERVSAEELVIIERAPLPTIAPHHASLLWLARRVFGSAIAADQGSTLYWTSGGAPTTVLTTDQELDKAQADAIATRWMEKRGLGPHYPAVLGKGAHAEAYGADPTRDASVEARRELVADVARLFGLPTRLVNAPAGDSRTYATTEADGLDLVRYTLDGFAGPIADAISELLPGDYLVGRHVEIDLSDLTRAEQEARYRAWGLALAPATAWMRPSEVRVAEGLAPDDELDELWLESIRAGAAPAPAPTVVVAPSASESGPGAAPVANPGANAGDEVSAAPGAILEGVSA